MAADVTTAPTLSRSLASAILLALGACTTAPPVPAAGPAAAPRAAATGCSVDLIVRFSPRIAAPGSQAFVAQLLAGTGYHLRVVRNLGTSQVLRLTGVDSTCDAGIAALRRDDRVLSVELDERQFRHMTRPE